MQRKPIRYAALLHLVDWKYPDKNVFELGDGVSLGRFEGTPLESLYCRLCNEYLIDEGEPFSYLSYVIVDPQSPRIPFDRGPESDVSRICNAIVVATGCPISMARIVSITDTFNYAGYSEIGPQSSEWRMNSFSNDPCLTNESLLTIRNLWHIDCRIRGNYNLYHRTITALDYFFYAWTAFYPEQVCINLAIAIESLFGPESRTEIAHQIAYNIARFVGSNPISREQIYDMIKRFYAVRSALVHGGSPDYKKVADLIPNIFDICSSILRKIILNEEWLSNFNNPEERKRLLREWLFT